MTRHKQRTSITFFEHEWHALDELLAPLGGRSARRCSSYLGQLVMAEHRRHPSQRMVYVEPSDASHAPPSSPVVEVETSDEVSREVGEITQGIQAFLTLGAKLLGGEATLTFDPSAPQPLKVSVGKDSPRAHSALRSAPDHREDERADRRAPKRSARRRR